MNSVCPVEGVDIVAAERVSLARIVQTHSTAVRFLVSVSDVKVKSLNKKLLIYNNITVPTHINSLSTKSAKSYNKY